MQLLVSPTLYTVSQKKNVIDYDMKIFTTLCSRFIQNTMYEILSASAEFRRRYDKSI